MPTQPFVRVFYCTYEVRSLMVELPIDDVLQQGAATLSPDEVAHLGRQLASGNRARIKGQDCWFEYETVDEDAA